MPAALSPFEDAASETSEPEECEQAELALAALCACEAAATPARPGCGKVLLAEDQPINRKVVQLILSAAGLHLTCVENGAEALAALQCEAFDIVLMDMQMPVLDGLSAIRTLRAREAGGGRRTPVISLTANALPHHVRASLDAGADEHMTKPISASLLLERVFGLIAAAEPLANRHAR